MDFADLISHTLELLPGVAPSLHDEVREAEAGRLQTLERENQELRGLLRVLQRQPGGQVSPLQPSAGPSWPPPLGLTIPLMCPHEKTLCPHFKRP